MQQVGGLRQETETGLGRVRALEQRARVDHGARAIVVCDPAFGREPLAQLAQLLRDQVVVVATGGVARDATAALELDRGARVRQPDHQQALRSRLDAARVEDPLGVAFQVVEPGVSAPFEPAPEALGVLRGPQGRDTREVEAELSSTRDQTCGGTHGRIVVGSGSATGAVTTRRPQSMRPRGVESDFRSGRRDSLQPRAAAR
jgi:hypothetical protein